MTLQVKPISPVIQLQPCLPVNTAKNLGILNLLLSKERCIIVSQVLEIHDSIYEPKLIGMPNLTWLIVKHHDTLSKAAASR